MHEESKLDEARFFYCKMSGSKDNRKHLEYYLSAFLSAARSVLQYELEEAKCKCGGQKWYEDQMKSCIFKFFRDVRDTSIHHEHISTVTEGTSLLDGKITITDSDSPVSETIQQPPDKPDIIQRDLYKLRAYPGGCQGNEDIFDLCKIYLDELKNSIEDGRKKGFLT